MSSEFVQDLVSRVVEGENPYEVLDETLNGINLFEDEEGIYFLDENDEPVYLSEEDLEELDIDIEEAKKKKAAKKEPKDTTPEVVVGRGKKRVVKMNPTVSINPKYVKSFPPSPVPREGKKRHHAKILALRAIASAAGRKAHGDSFVDDLARQGREKYKKAYKKRKEAAKKAEAEKKAKKGKK